VPFPVLACSSHANVYARMGALRWPDELIGHQCSEPARRLRA
jgi:hypothetical protein